MVMGSGGISEQSWDGAGDIGLECLRAHGQALENGACWYRHSTCLKTPKCPPLDVAVCANLHHVLEELEQLRHLVYVDVNKLLRLCASPLARVISKRVICGLCVCVCVL